MVSSYTGLSVMYNARPNYMTKENKKNRGDSNNLQ